MLSSQTIGVEFANKIIKVGSGPRRKRIKLQLWDTAGTERFRSVSRSYYRGAAGAILVYDISSAASFRALQPFLNDARALASPHLTTLLVGNKLDLAGDDASAANGHVVGDLIDVDDASSPPPQTPTGTSFSSANSYLQSTPTQATPSQQQQPRLGAQLKASVAPYGREVSAAEAARWATSQGIPATTEVSALSGEGVDDVFGRLARMILAKIELGEIDPDDPLSGIQYGDYRSGDGASGRDRAYAGGAGAWSDGGSVRSGMTGDSGARRRRTATGGGGGGGGGPLKVLGWGRRRAGTGSTAGGGGVALRDWEEVFTMSGRRSRGGCC